MKKKNKPTIEESNRENKVFNVSLEVADVLDGSELSDFEKFGVLEAVRLGMMLGMVKASGGKKNG